MSKKSPETQRPFSTLTRQVRVVASLSVFLSIGTAVILMWQTKALLGYFRNTVHEHQKESRQTIEKAKAKAKEWKARFQSFQKLAFDTLHQQGQRVIKTNALHWTFRMTCLYLRQDCLGRLRHIYLEPDRWNVTKRLTGTGFLHAIKELEELGEEEIYTRLMAMLPYDPGSDPLTRMADGKKERPSIEEILLQTDLLISMARVRVLRMERPVRNSEEYYEVRNRVIYDNRDPGAQGRFLRKDDFLKKIIDSPLYLRYFYYFQRGILEPKTELTPLLIGFSVQKVEKGNVDLYTFKGRHYVAIIPIGGTPYTVVYEVDLNMMLGPLWTVLNSALRNEFLVQLTSLASKFDEILHLSSNRYASIEGKIDKMENSAYGMMALSATIIILMVLFLYMMISHYVLQDLAVIDRLYSLTQRYYSEGSTRRKLAIEDEINDLKIEGDTPLSALAQFVRALLLDLFAINKELDELRARHEYLNKGISSLADDIMEISVNERWDKDLKGEPVVLTVPLRSLMNALRKHLYEIKEENTFISRDLDDLSRVVAQLPRVEDGEEIETVITSAIALTSELEERLDSMESTFDRLMEEYRNLHVVVSNIVLEGTKQHKGEGLQQVFEHINQTYDKLESSNSDLRKIVGDMRRAISEMRRHLGSMRHFITEATAQHARTVEMVRSLKEHAENVKKKLDVFRLMARHDEQYEKRLLDALEQVKGTLTLLRDVVTERSSKDTEDLGRITNEYLRQIHGVIEALEERLSVAEGMEKPPLSEGSLSEVLERHVAMDERSPFTEEREGDE